jgi:lipoprotein-releasing system permease protein
LDLQYFIAKKIALSGKDSFTSLIIRIGIAAVVLSVSTMIVAVSFINGFQSEIRNKVFSFWGHAHILPYSLSRSYNEAGIYKYQNFTKSDANLSYIEHIQPIVTKAGLIKTKTAFDGIVLRGVDSSFYWKKFKPYLTQGKIIEGDSMARLKQLIVSSATAKRLELELGDKVIIHFPAKEIRSRPFRISGIYETGIEEFDKEIAFADMSVLQNLNHWGSDTVSEFEVFYKEQTFFKSKLKSYFLIFAGGFLSEESYNEILKDPIDNITQDLNYNIEDISIEALSVKEIYPGLFDWLDIQTMNELIILILMVVVAGINIITALLIFVLVHTRMIGVLKALGADNKSIRNIFLYYGFIVIGFGVVLGNVIGVGLCLLQEHYHLIQLPADSYYVKYAPIILDWEAVITIDIATIIICMLSLLLPLRIIRNITPVKAIRFN